MKTTRSLLIPFLILALVACIGMLVSGCASTGGGKDGEPEAESPRRGDERSASLDRKSAAEPDPRPAVRPESRPLASTQPAAGAGGSGGTGVAQQAAAAGAGESTVEADRGVFRRLAASIKGALVDRFGSTAFPDMDWDRVGTVSVGVIFLLLIWGLAFWLARRPSRRQRADRTVRPRARAPQARDYTRAPVLQ